MYDYVLPVSTIANANRLTVFYMDAIYNYRYVRKSLNVYLFNVFIYNMYLARYEVQCKRYEPNSKSIAHLSNVKIHKVQQGFIFEFSYRGPFLGQKPKILQKCGILSKIIRFERKTRRWNRLAPQNSIFLTDWKNFKNCGFYGQKC